MYGATLEIEITPKSPPKNFSHQSHIRSLRTSHFFVTISRSPIGSAKTTNLSECDLLHFEGSGDTYHHISKVLNLNRLVTFKRDTMQQPAMSMIIIQRVMQCAPIVPNRDISNLPAQAALKFRRNLMGKQKRQ